jgi:hypothetical protein
MRFLLRATTALALMLPAVASAQSPGPFTTAEILPANGHSFGAYLVSGDNVLGLLSQLRLSFYPGVDFGFQGGLARYDVPGGSDRTVLRVGTDVRLGLLTAGRDADVDLALGGGLSIQAGDDFGEFTLGPSVVASRAFPLGSSGAIAPYGQLGIAYSSLDAGPVNDTDVWLPLHFGAEIRPNPYLRVVADVEFRLNNDFGDDWGFTAGVNLPF